MNCSFTYSSTTYTYYVDEVTITPRVTGSQSRLISGGMDSDFQDIEFQIVVRGVFEQVGASGKSANQIWLDALGGAAIAFSSDTDDGTSYNVVADYSHSPVFVDTGRGTYREAVELRFFSSSVYQEDHSTSTAIAGLRPHFGA